MGIWETAVTSVTGLIAYAFARPVRIWFTARVLRRLRVPEKEVGKWALEAARRSWIDAVRGIRGGERDP